MKEIICILFCMASFVSKGWSAVAKPNTNVSSKGYWVIENRPDNPGQAIVYYYDNSDNLLQSDTISIRNENFLDTGLKRRLKKRLDTLVTQEKEKSNDELEDQLVAELFVSDIERSIEFYTSLGFQLVRESKGFAVLGWDNATILLDERKLPTENTLRCNIRVMVANVDHYWLKVNEKSSRFVVAVPIADRYYGLRDFTILDPDGFGIRFASRLSMQIELR